MAMDYKTPNRMQIVLILTSSSHLSPEPDMNQWLFKLMTLSVCPANWVY